MEMFPVILLKIFTPPWRFSTTFLDFSKLMSSPKTEELCIFQTCYMKPNLTSNIKIEKIKQRIKCFVKKKLDNLKNKPTGVLQKFYAKMLTLPASDDITRFGIKQANIKRIRSIFASIRIEANRFFKQIWRTQIRILPLILILPLIRILQLPIIVSNHNF
jgi:hypothetical protein